MYTIDKPQTATSESPVSSASEDLELGYSFEVMLPKEIVAQINQDVDAMPECRGVAQYILDAVKMRLSLSPVLAEAQAALAEENDPTYEPLARYWQEDIDTFQTDGGAVEAA